MTLRAIFDLTQVAFWALTYALMIYYWAVQTKPRRPLIPITACCLNFGWEINATIATQTLNISVIWLCLDIVIFIQSIATLKTWKARTICLSVLLTVVMVLMQIFNLQTVDGQLYSSFVIDIYMAVAFLARYNVLASKGQKYIACTKLIGDLFAWLVYGGNVLVINIIGAAVLLLNILYLAVCLEKNE